MLGKLICFDMKSSARLLLPLHAALLATSIVGRFLMSFDIINRIPDIYLGLMIAFYVILIVCTGIISSFYFIYWFYKNLFTDEGYLMHTLPVPSWQHIVSKFTGMLLWEVIDASVILLCLTLLITSDASYVLMIPVYARKLLQQMAADLQTTVPVLILVSLLIFILQMLARGLSAFFCITLGQLFNRHRVLSAFLSYIVFSIVISVLSAALLSATGYETACANTTQAMHMATAWEIIGDLALALLCFFGTNYLMKRRLNLE